jgi:hypothetical protein
VDTCGRRRAKRINVRQTESSLGSLVSVYIILFLLLINTLADAANDWYDCFSVDTGRWKAEPMVYVPFTKSDLTLLLKTSSYYVPIDENHPTYLRFFHITVHFPYKGPILNPQNKMVLNKVQ